MLNGAMLNGMLDWRGFERIGHWALPFGIERHRALGIRH
jgi:hypothetical protein